MSATLIKNLDYIVTVDESATVLRNASILIVDGTIVAVGNVDTHPQAANAKVVDGSGKLMMPGMVNLHTHTPMTLLRGLSEDVDLQGFLQKVWAAEGAAMDPETAHLGAQLGALESLLAGSTTQLDMYFHHVDVHRGAIEVGTRHIGGPTLFDFPGPDKKSWEERMAYVESWPKDLAALGGPAVPTNMSPHGTYTISPEHLTDLAAIAKSWDNSLFAIHISENAAENADVISRYGKTPTKLLATTGALDGDLRVVFGHGVHLDAEDREIVAKAKVAVAHCPGSNLKLASGALRWQQYRADGVRVGIGTDGCSSSNDLDMFQALRQAGLLARLTLGRADQTPAIDFIRGATIEGARAVGMGDVIGSIEVGKRADLVLLDLDAPHLVPVNDVHALIVFAAGRGDVCDVYVDGELVLDNRKSTRIDHKELLSKSRARGAVAAEAAAKA